MKPLYFIERDYGALGKAFIECERSSSCREHVVEAILSGELGKVIKVLEVNEAKKSAVDITADIARECHARFLADRPDEISWELLNFFHEHVGLRSVPGGLQAAE